MEVGRKSVGEFKLDLPSADPGLGIEEIQRRSGVITNPGSDTLLPPDVMARRRRAFEDEFTGYWIINCANKEFSTECACPNTRLLRFIKAEPCKCEPQCDGTAKCAVSMAACSAKADAVIRLFMQDARVKSIPIKIPTHAPFQIPFSEASAQNARHTHGKIQRNVARHLQFTQYRNEEFNKHVSEKTPGETGKSSYSRRKAYLNRQKQREQGRDGRLDAVPAGLPPLPELPPILYGGGGGETTAPILTVSETPPPVIWTEALPAHWLPGAKAEIGDEDTWPRDLEARHGRFAVLAFIDDEDEETDDPAWARAAKCEPIVILFGEMHETVEVAKEFLLKRISPWCPDLVLDVVDMYEWLWPTEVDPDAVEEQHRTQHAGFDKELNTVMSTRKETLNVAAEARKQAAASGTLLREDNLNAIPDISGIVDSRRSGMVSYEITETEPKAAVVVEKVLPSI